MFPQRIGVGVSLLAITGVLLAGVVALWSGPALAVPTTGEKSGGAVSGSEVVMKAVPEPEKAVKVPSALPGHGGFCATKVESDVARSTVMGRGQVVMKTPLPGHGGFLAPGEEC